MAIGSDEKKISLSAFLGGFIAGIFAFFYIFVNDFSEGDNVWDHLGIGGGAIFQGRWLLGFLSNLRRDTVGDHSLQFFNGMMGLLLLSIAAIFVVKILEIRKQLLAVLAAAVFTTFPTVAYTYMYMYLAIYFLGAVLLAVLGAYLIHSVDLNKNIGKIVLNGIISAILIACSVGIYQAYFPLAVTLVLCGFMIRLVKGGDQTIGALLRRIVYDLVVLGTGMLLYFLGNFAMKTIKHIDVMEMHGTKMGELSARQIPGIVSNMYSSYFGLFSQNSYGITNTGLARLLWFIIVIFSVILVVIGVIRRIKAGDVVSSVLLCICTIVFPAAVNLICLMVPGEGAGIYIMMVYSIVGVLLLPIGLLSSVLENEDKRKIAYKVLITGTQFVMCTILLYHIAWANRLYQLAEYSFEEAKSYYTTLITRIRSVEGYEPELPVVYIGDINDPTIYDITDDFSSFRNIAGTGDSGNYILKFGYGYRNQFMRIWCGFDPILEEETPEIKTIPEIEDMPCYPSHGSIRRVGDRIIVKFE